MYYVGADLGGTNLAAGIVDKDGHIIAKDSVPTGEPDAEKIAARTAEVIFRLLSQAGIDRRETAYVGVGVPGTADRDAGTIEYANNLGMEGVPFLELLAPYFPGIPTGIENDANAAAYAEYLFGAGRGSRSMVMVTLGTGIGAGIIIDGALWEGVNYAAGELGHMVLYADGLPCNCGRRGCFERYASASALAEQAQSAMREDKDSVLWELCCGNIGAVDGKLLFDAVRQNDAAARRVLDKFTEYLADGIVNIVNFLQPEVVCIGGGISCEGELLLGTARERLLRFDYARTSRKRTRLAAAALGNDAGIIGAALLAANRKKNGGDTK